MLQPVKTWLSFRRLGIIFISLVLVATVTIALVRQASAATSTLWPNSAAPATASYTGDTASVELGVKFRAANDGSVTGVRFYKGATNTGTHTGTLWDSSGNQLATLTFNNETASGWQQASFTTPVAISANTTYIVSYHAPNGNYAITSGYFAGQSVTNGALTALQDGTEGGNGVFKYGSGTVFPDQSYNATNYWVDPVFTDDTVPPPDTTAPTITTTSPTSGATNIAIGSNLTASFSEPLDANTVNTTSFSVKTGTAAALPASVTYNTANNTITLDPTNNLANGTTYSATLTTAIKDAAGNALASSYTWTFTTAASATINPLTQGPGGPILVLQNPDLPFSGYTSEMLRAEGLNSFATADARSFTSTTLTGYSVIVLGDVPLTSAQVTTLTTWVNGGGNLIALHPDKKLSGLLGLTDSGTTLNEGYVSIDTTQTPGSGLPSQTLQFHGSADRYTANTGTRTIATLYSDATTATTNPAVTVRSVGTSGGQAVAFTYDLARSVVLTHQGNPAWDGDDRDGSAPIRTNDLFFGNKPGDPQTDYVNLDKVQIPQADEQMRLLSNTIGFVNIDKTPLPKFWYFPNDKKAVMVMAGDDHATQTGTKDSFDYLLAQSPANCVVSNWECFRSTSWTYESSPLTNTEALAYKNQGFDIGSHISTGCANFDFDSLTATFTSELTGFRNKYTSLPNQTGSRTHCIVWSDYDSTPKVEKANGIRIDLNYYYWPASWVANRPGYMTGSGLTMRYTDKQGVMQDVYQKASDLVNEAGNFQNPTNIDKQLDRALGPEGYYGAIGTHYDYSDTFDRQLVQSAKARNVPIVSVQQLLDWTDGRNASKFSTPTWSGNNLNFTTTVDAKAGTKMKSMLPVKSSKGILTSITKSGTAVAFTTEYRKGVLYAIFPASTGSFTAAYAADTTAPSVASTTPANNATGVASNTTIKAVFSEGLDATTVNNSTFTLRKSDNTIAATTATYDHATKTVTVTPTDPLAGQTTYTLTIRGGTSDPRVKDVNGNGLAANRTVTFTTAAAQFSVWYPNQQTVSTASSDTASVELGTKFSVSQAGTIKGIAFYKGASDPASSHTVTLWDSAGNAIATAATSTETASGWQTASFATPVSVSTGITYTASYRAPNGNYSYTSGNLSSGATVGPLSVPANGGVYNYGSGMPASTFGGANYWVDVLFQ